VVRARPAIKIRYKRSRAGVAEGVEVVWMGRRRNWLLVGKVENGRLNSRTGYGTMSWVIVLNGVWDVGHAQSGHSEGRRWEIRRNPGARSRLPWASWGVLPDKDGTGVMRGSLGGSAR
jgi:hypothetical protein